MSLNEWRCTPCHLTCWMIVYEQPYVWIQSIFSIMNATTQVQSMTIWWIFLVLYGHQVVYVNWFPGSHAFTRWMLPSHQPPKSGSVIGAWSYANLPPSSSLWVMNSYVLWQWWTWEIVRKIQEVKPCTSSLVLHYKDYVMHNLHQCTSFLLANWTFINGRFFFPLLVNNPKFYFKCGEVRYTT